MMSAREFRGWRAIGGNLVSTWTALDLADAAANTGPHRPETSPYQTDGEVKVRWMDQTRRWLVFEQHTIYHLESGAGKLHMWNTTYHCLPPPSYTIEAIANPNMPQGMSPGQFLRDLEIRCPAEMYRDLGQPDALETYGKEFMDVMYQILDRIQGAMAELRNQEEDRRGN